MISKEYAACFIYLGTARDGREMRLLAWNWSRGRNLVRPGLRQICVRPRYNQPAAELSGMALKNANELDMLQQYPLE